MIRNLAVWLVDILSWTACRVIDSRCMAQWIEEDDEQNLI